MGSSCPQFLTKFFCLSCFLSPSLLFSSKHLQSGKPWPKDSYQVGRGRRASVEDGMFSNSSCRGETSVGQVGPLAQGDL